MDVEIELVFLAGSKGFEIGRGAKGTGSDQGFDAESVRTGNC